MRDRELERYINIGYPIDAVPGPKFAEMIGKPASAVSDMISDGKLPIVKWQNPNALRSRAENWVYIPEFNKAMREAFFARPKEQWDAWLLWIGL